MTFRHLLVALNLALLATAASAENAAGTADDPLQLNNYRCRDFGLVQVAFASGRAIILMDGRTLSLPYTAELPGDVHLYADASTAMVLGDDNLFIGPLLRQGNAVIRPARECFWES